MKILLINNGTKHLIKLKKAFSGNELRVIELDKIIKKHIDWAEGIVLSGGSYFSVKKHKKEFGKELELIKKSCKPVLGICLGFELIVVSFGGVLGKIKKKFEGFKKIKIIRRDPIIKGIGKSFKAYEGHKWIAQKTGQLVVIGKSNFCPEIVKHPTKNIYGVQFHPEMSGNKSSAYKIIKNFLKIAEG